MRGLGGILFGALIASGTAEAGPWAQAPGGIYARAMVSAERLDGEDGWRLTGKVESVRYDGGTADTDAYRVSARRQLWSSGNGWAVGAEAAVIHGSTLAGIYGCQG